MTYGTYGTYGTKNLHMEYHNRTFYMQTVEE